MPDDAVVTGHRWMTYREIAAALGLPSVKAAEARVRRAGWRRQPGNDGAARSAVPLFALEAPRSPPRGGHEFLNRGDAEGATAGATLRSTDSAVFNALAKEVRAAHERAERAEAHEAEARALAERRGGEIAELRQQLGRVESELKALRTALDDAKATRDEAESRAMAEREDWRRERERAERLEAERDDARAELAKWRAGGPLTRAYRALFARQVR